MGKPHRWLDGADAVREAKGLATGQLRWASGEHEERGRISRSAAPYDGVQRDQAMSVLFTALNRGRLKAAAHPSIVSRRIQPRRSIFGPV